MDFDHIIVGSGLTALATALGLPRDARVCVVGSPVQPNVQRYPGTQVPVQNIGRGGLGNYWHGVIPMGESVPTHANTRQAFTQLFDHFYPGNPLAGRLDEKCYFVPYKPIRPQSHWAKAMARLSSGSQLMELNVDTVEQRDGHWHVKLRQDSANLRARHLWLAAGALGTPAILARCEALKPAVRSTVSDHVIISLGQTDRQHCPKSHLPTLKRSRSGTWFHVPEAFQASGFVTMRPAHFDFRTLDTNMAERSVFGLPTSGILGKLMRARSLGLLAESAFNKFGLFAGAARMNVYAQLRVPDALCFNAKAEVLSLQNETILNTIGPARQHLVMPGLVPTQLPDLFSHGIHLHNSVDADIINGLTDETFHIVDASVLPTIGHTHHSFRCMATAHAQARKHQ
jgi:hypothetical protein